MIGKGILASILLNSLVFPFPLLPLFPFLHGTSFG